MKTKTCTSTEVIIGCGKVKPETDFQRTGSTGRMGVCLECLVNFRRGTVKVRRKRVTTDETNLYNQLNKLMRTI